MRRLIALTAAIALAGCSFVFTSGPSVVAGPPPAYPDCTTAMTWPVIDGVFGGIMLTATLAQAFNDDPADPADPQKNRAGAIVSTALLGTALVASAYIGHGRVSRCRSARSQFMAAVPGGGGPAEESPYAEPSPPDSQDPPAIPTPPPPTSPTPAPVLGTEGDVCMASSECAAGLTCSGNVCIRLPARPAGRR